MERPRMRIISYAIFSLFLVCCLINLSNGQSETNSIYHHSKYRRHVVNHNDILINVEWLTDEQLSTLGTLDSVSQVEKIREFYDQLVDKEELKSAANKIVTQCYEWLPEVTTQEERDEIKELHHMDNHNECKQRIAEYIQRLPEEKQTQLRRYWPFCEHVWYSTIHQSHKHHQRKDEDELEVEGNAHASQDAKNDSAGSEPEQHEEGHHKDHRLRRRLRREPHHDHSKHKHDKVSLADTTNEHLDWLNSHQKELLESLHSQGKPTKEILAELAEIYEEASGDVKATATHEIQCACKEISKALFGEAQIERLRQLRHDGVPLHELERRVMELADGLSKDEDKRLISDHMPICKKVFLNLQPSRKRRHGDYNLEDYLKTHLSWLADDQKEQLRSLKASGGDKQAMQAKIMEFVEQSPAETKLKAIQLLQGRCKELLRSVVGDANTEELKKMKESGASLTEIGEKVEEMVAEVQDEHKKLMFKEYSGTCRKLFAQPARTGAGRRLRRQEAAAPGKHTLEDYFKSHLTWLTDAQKDELRAMKKAGQKKEAIQDKVFDFYDAATGETKQKASELMQGGCRALLKSIVGEDKANMIKALKEKGATLSEIQTKVEQLIEELADEQQKIRAKEYGPACKRLFTTAPSRARRDHHMGDGHHGDGHDHSLDAYFKTQLSWLSDAQKEELRQMQSSGKTQEEMQAKSFDFYNQATGETKEKATKLMQDGCRQLLKTLVGEEKLGELKTMKDNGASTNDISAKVEQWLAEVQNDHMKAVAKSYGPLCRSLFGVTRKRRVADRSYESNDVEEHIDHKKHHWLTSEQKEVLENMKDEGKDGPSIQQQILDFFHVSSDDVKGIARNLLIAGCEKLVESFFGTEKAEELRTMRQNGASASDIEDKMKDFAEDIDDDQKRDQALEYSSNCKRVFTMIMRKRRTPPTMHLSGQHHYHNLEEYFLTHLQWLTEEEKETLRELKHNGASRFEMQQNIADFFDQAQGERQMSAKKHFKMACLDILHSILGEQNTLVLKKKLENTPRKRDQERQVILNYLKHLDKEGEIDEREFGASCRKALHLIPVAQQKP